MTQYQLEKEHRRAEHRKAKRADRLVLTLIVIALAFALTIIWMNLRAENRNDELHSELAFEKDLVHAVSLELKASSDKAEMIKQCNLAPAMEQINSMQHNLEVILTHTLIEPYKNTGRILVVNNTGEK